MGSIIISLIKINDIHISIFSKLNSDSEKQGGAAHFQFKFGLKDEPKKRKQPTNDKIEREAKPGKTRAAVISRLTYTSMADFAKPGQSRD